MWLVTITLLALILSGMALYRAWNDHYYLKKEIKSLEAVLQQAERLTKLRGHLAREVAHEIKNPIAAINSSAQTLELLASKNLSADHRLTLHYIKEYSEHVLQLVSDFLDISMSDSGLLKTRPEVLNVKDSLEPIIGLLEAEAEKSSISLKLLCNDAELAAFIDARHLKQIVFNLVHNALRNTNKNGKVQVVIESDFPAKYVKICIRDNGIGIPADKLSEIFDPYKRIDNGKSENFTGLGLGLALCNNLVRLAGGSIEVDSQPNIGSCFTVRLPCYSSVYSATKTITTEQQNQARGAILDEIH